MKYYYFCAKLHFLVQEAKFFLIFFVRFEKKDYLCSRIGKRHLCLNQIKWKFLNSYIIVFFSFNFI